LLFKFYYMNDGKNKRSKFKTKERAVVMLLGNNHLALLVKGVHIIMMIKDGIVYIFLGHYPCQEHHEQKRA